jgi:uncharacterized protein HemX
LSADQQQLARERLKLRLLGARQALLARNDRLFRADLANVQAMIGRYFDSAAPAVEAAQAHLKQIAAMTMSVDAPRIGESLAALHALRPVPAAVTPIAPTAK